MIFEDIIAGALFLFTVIAGFFIMVGLGAW